MDVQTERNNIKERTYREKEQTEKKDVCGNSERISLKDKERERH